MKKHDIFLWILFAVLVLYRCTETIYDGWLVLAFISCVIAVVLLVKNKLPSKNSLVNTLPLRQSERLMWGAYWIHNGACRRSHCLLAKQGKSRRIRYDQISGRKLWILRQRIRWELCWRLQLLLQKKGVSMQPLYIIDCSVDTLYFFFHSEKIL